MTHYWFISTKYRPNAKLALITFLLAFVVILLGAYTRLTDAGLSCPDWPNCYGFLTAPHTATQLHDALQKFPTAPVNIKKAWTEMTHRYVAGTEGLLIIALCFSLLFSRRVPRVKGTVIAITLLCLLGIQVTLGMLTVTEKLKPIIVLSHLITGLSLLSVLWWAYLELPLRDDRFLHTNHPPATPWLWLGLIIISSQIILGGWVSAHYAGLACIDFPYCNGKLFPIEWHRLHEDLISIHLLHRLGALITAIYLTALSIYLLRRPAFRWLAGVLIGFVLLQLTLGILNILWLRPVWLALIHHAVAILILLTMLTAIIKAYCQMRSRTHHGNIRHA